MENNNNNMNNNAPLNNSAPLNNEGSLPDIDALINKYAPIYNDGVSLNNNSSNSTNGLPLSNNGAALNNNAPVRDNSSVNNGAADIPRNTKKPFKVHIDDKDYMAPSDIKKTTPSVPQKKKFEVHIDDYDVSQPVVNEYQPKYKGEIYFSNRKPVKHIEPVSETVESKTTVTRKPAPKKSAPKNKKRKKKHNTLLIFCSFVFVLTCAFSVFGIICVNDILAINRSSDKVAVEIPLNADTDEVLDILKENGLIKQKLFCKFYLEFIQIFTGSKEPEYNSGVYYLEKNMGLEGMLNDIKYSNNNKETVWLVFPEGWTFRQMFERLDKAGVCSYDELMATLKNTEFEYDFIQAIENDGDRPFTLEGYLCPDTYEFFLDSDANSVIRKLLGGSETNWTEEYEKRAKELGYTRDEIIILASIIQSEAANSDQMGMISQILHNRLDRPSQYPKLECNSTEDYIVKRLYDNQIITEGQKNTFLPLYDTYSITGFPPGPICNPGEDAIYAALYPDGNYSSYFYFRHDVRGTIYIAKTNEEHEENGNIVLSVNEQYAG